MTLLYIEIYIVLYIEIRPTAEVQGEGTALGRAYTGTWRPWFSSFPLLYS